MMEIQHGFKDFSALIKIAAEQRFDPRLAEMNSAAEASPYQSVADSAFSGNFQDHGIGRRQRCAGPIFSDLQD